MENVRSGRLNYQVQVLHTGESNTADKLTGGEEAQFNNEADEQKVIFFQKWAESNYGVEENLYAEEEDSEQSQVRRAPDEGKGYIGEFSADYINTEIFFLFHLRGESKITQ